MEVPMIRECEHAAHMLTMDRSLSTAQRERLRLVASAYRTLLFLIGDDLLLITGDTPVDEDARVEMLELTKNPA